MKVSLGVHEIRSLGQSRLKWWSRDRGIMKVNLDVGEIKGLKTPVLDPNTSSLSELLLRVY